MSFYNPNQYVAGSGSGQQGQPPSGGQQFFNPTLQQQQQYGYPQQQMSSSPTVGSNQFFNPTLQQQGYPQQQMMGSSSPSSIVGGQQQPQQFFDPTSYGQQQHRMMGPPPTTGAFEMGSPLNQKTSLPPPTSFNYDPTQTHAMTTGSHPPVMGGVQQQQQYGVVQPTGQIQQGFSPSSFGSTPPTVSPNSNDSATFNTSGIDQINQQTQQQTLGTPKPNPNTKIDPRQMPTPTRLPFPEVNIKQEYQTPSFLEHYMLASGGVPTTNSFNGATITQTSPLGSNVFNQPTMQQPQKSGIGDMIGGIFGGNTSNLPFNAMAAQQPSNSASITPYFNVPPPPADRRCKVVCKGACAPDRIRPTLWCMPNTKKLLDASQLVMGAMVQPMASFDSEDQPNFTPTLDYTSYEILRCSRCRAYINPFMKFVENGKRFQCNFCGFSNETPDWYYCPTDVYGVRTDIYQRPELSVGDVDFLATKAYISKAREPQPISLVYVIDVSYEANQQGILKSVIQGLKASFKDFGPKYRNCKITFITFAKTIHFYNFRSAKSTIKQVHPQVMIVADLNEGFVPIPQDSMVTIGDIIYGENNASYTEGMNIDEDHMNQFLDRFFEFASSIEDRTQENVAGSAMKCAEELLNESGGRIMLFTSKVPTMGPGNFTLPPNASSSEQERRNPYKIYGTDREKELFIPELGFWKNLGISCAKKQIGIDLFLFPKTFIETANLSSAAQTTGGHVYMYQQYTFARDSDRVILDLKRHFERENGYDAVLKIRTSSGIGVRRHFGHFFQQTEDDLDLAVIDADSSFGVEFKHDESVLSSSSETGNHYIQTALLYTSAHDGKRYVRVQTTKMKTATDFNTLYRRADIGATLGLLSRLFVHQVVQNRDTLETVRDMMSERLTNLLACYRKNCSTNSGSGQLILPETLKFLPLYILGLAKSPAFCRYTRVSLDKKIHAFHLLMKFSCRQAMYYCYPRLFDITNLEFNDETSALSESSESPSEEFIPITTDSNGSRYPIPPLLDVSSSQISSDGIYMMYDGNECLFWVGKNAPQDKVTDLFGVNSVDELVLLSAKPTISLCDNDDNDITIPNAPFPQKVKFIMKEHLPKGVQYGGVFVYRENSEGTDGSFFIRMVEDKFGSGISSNPVDKSYTDFLCILHREVLKQI